MATLGDDGKVPAAQLPAIPAAQVQADWNEADSSAVDFIKNKPTVPTALSQLSSDSTHRTVTDTEKTTWNNKSDFSGSYNDLTDKPTIPTQLSQLSADSTHRTVTDTEKSTWNAKSDFSGSYNDLTDKPTIPAAQVQSDWSQANAAEVDFIKNKPSLATVATSGNYNDLTNRPTIPSTAADVGAIPTTEKGANNGVAELDANAKVPAANLPLATSNTVGAVKASGNGGISVSSDGHIQLIPATNINIDARTNGWCPIVPNKLDYAVRSVLPGANRIPDATSVYELSDAANPNDGHVIAYYHYPTSEPTYILPLYLSETTVHDIILTVYFSSPVLSYQFLDTYEMDINPLSTPEIVDGSVICFLCRYEPGRQTWAIMPVSMGVGFVS